MIGRIEFAMATIRAPGRGTFNSPNAYHFVVALPRRLYMFSFLLWCILFVLCWPAAIVALILFPIVWLLLLPLRLLGIAVGGVLELIKAVLLLPARLLSTPFRA
jgi:hypothetical protein